MTGSVGGLVGNFFAYQYCGFVGHMRLNTTADVNPSRCWKKVKAIDSKYQSMPHRDAMKALRQAGFSVRRIGKIAIGASTLRKGN